MTAAGPATLGLYVLRRLPREVLDEFSSLDFAMYLTTRGGRLFAEHLVAGQLADELCWGDEDGSDSWVERLGMRCPFMFSHSIILAEKFHSHVLNLRRKT